MKEVRLIAPYQFQVNEVPVPTPGPGQVLLKNLHLGVCASDQQIYHGKHKYCAMPVVMGHEVSAVVAGLGEGVTGYALGDRVVIQPQLVCGECYPCSIGRFNVCEHLKVIGVHADGCACEYIAVPAWNLHKLPDAVSDVDAALVEPLAVGFGSARRAGDLRGANVAVIGAGIIGNFAAQAAKALGAEKVLISDVVPVKLAAAEQVGIDYPMDASKMSLKEGIEKYFGSFRKADVIIDCAASAGSFASALEAARRSSVVVFTGNYKAPVEFDVPVIQRSEVSLVGHMMYVREDFTDAIQGLAEGKIKTEGLVRQRFSLDEYEKAFQYADANPADVIKMVIDI